ncbi:hypothetical protein BXA09_08610 [Campylobacter upsaliensis]|uniref:hypothetical protein n=2 Tax=Campylobacter upsaliensis TaxID=28080 RepID=UPI0011774C1D|nr:hypothetical protein [Campylobacter upsaliensis]EAH9986990.1 hypothetical protein [Campylobacter upsaliensis]EAI2901205.1 hypothetical protein [Campylobacter upsaliensis]EAI5398587.1 hypothetical protein [Campylobacter upsaliensis]EAI7259366.1 hypothetical protein [Campylobacter upsaliensis]EAI8172691.1 hypothetical protein [Campylobacter upsaliensis]
MMNKKRKQALKNTNAKIVWTKNYESELLFELLMKNNDIFTALRQKMGQDFEIERAVQIQKAYHKAINSMSSLLEKLSKELELDYKEGILLAELKAKIQKEEM